VLETIAWLAYLVPVLVVFLLPARKSRAGGSTPQPVPNVVPETPQHVEARA
jgi:high-affinity iron transporter